MSDASVTPLDPQLVKASYTNIFSNLTTQNDRVYVTGGALILALAEKFSFHDDELNEDKVLTVAGKELSYRGIWLLWKFYSVLNFYGYKFACVDERLLPDTATSGIHEHCGACAACAELLGLHDGEEVENYALNTLHRDHKQEIMHELEHDHASVGILVSCGDLAHSISNEDKHKRYKEVGSVPFHVSFPVEKIKLFASNLSTQDKTLFYKTLIDWEFGIVLRIIAGEHNIRAKELNNTGLYVAFVDSVEKDDLLELLKSGILQNISEIFHNNAPQVNFVEEKRK